MTQTTMTTTISLDKPTPQGVSDVIIPALTVPEEVSANYWLDLEKANLLRYRLCDLKDPTWHDAMHMMQTLHPHSLYFLVDPTDMRITAEFLLTNFSAKTAQVHFSMHPDNTPQRSLHLARRVTTELLNEWTVAADNKEPYLLSLFGLTPINNRAACAFIQRVGFKKAGVLPGGQLYEGEPTDAMITIKARTV